MIKLIITLFLCIGTQSISYSQNGWFWLNPQPHGSSLNSVIFVNAQTGIAAGNMGAILRSTDAGESWNLYISNFTNDINSVAYYDENNIFAVGSDGFIIKSVNTGLDWERLSIGTNEDLSSVYFYDSNSGYITGSNGKIFKTSDGGNNWSELNSGTTIKLNTAYFINSQNGFIGGNEIILRTTNGGINWTALNLNTYINSMSFINDNTGFIVGASSNGIKSIRRTSNGGNTWINVFAPGTYTFNEIFFTNSSTGYIAGNENAFLKTTNSGVNWFIDNTISSQGFALNSVFFQNNGTGLLAGTYGTIFKSTDHGNFWTQKSPSGTLEGFRSADFPDQNTGYILGNSDNNGSSILKTTNAGLNWVNFNTSFGMKRFDFINEITGYAVSGRFELIKTQNGGLIWNLLNTPIDSIGLFQFVDANTGFIGKTYFSGHDLNKTTDGGISWSSYSFQPEYVTYFQFPSHDIGYVLTNGTADNLYKTTNTGVNWNFVRKMDFDTIIPNLGSLYFLDENIGFIATYYMYSLNQRNNYIYKTSDGGLSWRQVLDLNVSGQVGLGFKFFNINTGYVLGLYNKVLKSTDQGESWNEFLNLDRPVNDLDFTDNNTGYIIGAGGMILKTTTGGTVSLENISSEIPSGFILNQNYPNPFNPSTVIRYSLAENGFINLKVYDLTGKTVAVLVNENQKTGSYEVNFDGYNLASGIYFYKLSVNDFTQTKKMVLLK